MKKIIMFGIALLATLLISSPAVIMASNSSISYEDNLIILESEAMDEYSWGNDTYEITSIDINYEYTSCTVTVTGSIGVSGTSISVSISVTADTCGEAIAEAINSFKELRSQIMELF
jgi:hypothetical protein